MACNAAASMDAPTNGAITSVATSANGLPAKAAMVSGESVGQISGT